MAEVAEPDPRHLSVITALTAVDADNGTLLASLQDRTLEDGAVASGDPEYIAFRDIILHGFPDEKHSLDPSDRPYWNV